MLKPNGDRLVIEADSAKQEKLGAIVIPEGANKEKVSIGTVRAAGPGRTNEKGDIVSMPFSVGDRVVFEKYSAITYKEDEKEYLIVRENNILGSI